MIARSRYSFLTPALVLVALIYLFPLGILFDTSLHSVQGYVSQWVGFTNFQLVLTDPNFAAAVLHNLLLLVVCVPVIIVIAVFVSVFLLDEIPGSRFFRVFILVPYMFSVPVVAVVFSYFLQGTGPFNTILRSIGLGFVAKNWLGSPHWALVTLMGIIIWKELGFGVVLFYARLLSIPKELFEAVTLDGAGWWQQLFHIIIPQLRGIFEFYIVTEGITMLSWVFNYVYIISNGTGGPGTSTLVTELYIYQNAFGYGSSSLGIASAAATIMFFGLIGVIILGLPYLRGESQ